jgi:SH2 domain
VARHRIQTRRQDASFKRVISIVYLLAQTPFNFFLRDYNWAQPRWNVRHCTTKKFGFIPCNLVADEEYEFFFYQNHHLIFYFSIFIKLLFFLHVICRWFVDQTSLAEIENLLLDPVNRLGTFIVHRTDQEQKGFSLSFKNHDGVQPFVDHYDIQFFENHYHFACSSYASLQALVEEYRGKQYKIKLKIKILLHNFLNDMNHNFNSRNKDIFLLRFSTRA